MEARDFLNFIGARVVFNKKALEFSRDLIINTKWNKTGIMKSKRQGTVVGLNKFKSNNIVYILWDGNRTKVPERAEFLEIIFFDKSQSL